MDAQEENYLRKQIVEQRNALTNVTKNADAITRKNEELSRAVAYLEGKVHHLECDLADANKLTDSLRALLSDARDATETTESDMRALLLEVISMIGRKSRRRNKRRLKEIELSLTPPGSHLYDEAELRS